MRDLIFIVDKQNLFKNPKCNFENIIIGSSNYLRCVFKFDSDWNGLRKVAVFSDKNNAVPVLIENNRCMIPNEMTNKNLISIYVIGQRGNQRIKTNEEEIEQEGGSIWQQ